MPLQPGNYQRIPARTMRTAWAACPKGTPVMLVRDRLDVLFEDEEFADLYPAAGRPGFPPGQLALVSVLQFTEDLSDRAAAQAVRTRIEVPPGPWTAGVYAAGVRSCLSKVLVSSGVTYP
ncbi:transposase, partial [Streptomyces sp. ME08-AFT2]|uniref:transposase n=1 Tax=Streptomyces sp. ME08-AFT2 TaxID=3028683 RepID=UPI0029AA31D4